MAVVLALALQQALSSPWHCVSPWARVPWALGSVLLQP